MHRGVLYRCTYIAILLQRGKHIETFVMVIDLKNLSLTRQFYWPGIRYIIEVSEKPIMDLKLWGEF